ncbi:DUF3099 domain-containing protein [Nesterenkonia flava]|uniref:DUF3099 domain-containing protein n=1 Tax=Nesterenkonia flava TaxID=469799 RepID=A0ABU1FTX3_9MICC|nr:DUF3099 domain-containing protein [Nesterenkonia flava]MDR5712101.1 DUF3099 domain-containing protein [Nesterenkonia flava]
MAEQVHSITDAPVKHSDEQRGRMVRYTVSMSIRLVCFILAVVVGVVWESWWALAFIVGAVVLPYVAVVDANAGGERYTLKREAEGLEARTQLTTGHEEPADEPRQWWEEDDDVDSPTPQAPEVISGEVIAEDQSAQPPPAGTEPGDGPDEPKTSRREH